MVALDIVHYKQTTQFDLIYGIRRGPKGVSTALVKMYPPKTVSKMQRGELSWVERSFEYIVKEGPHDEISEFKEFGALSPWPIPHKDDKFLKWIRESLEEMKA